jgi:hypothetical protein
MPASVILTLAATGVLAGLVLLVRGLRAQRSAAQIGDIGTSPVGLLAAGEVRVTGQAVPAGLTLNSPLRLRPSLYYHAVVTGGGGRDGEHTLFDEERAVGFFVRDATGEARVFPRSARWEVPLDAATASAEGGTWGTAGGLLLGTDPGIDPLHPGRTASPDFAMPALVGLSAESTSLDRRVSYREARIEPGDIVTVVGRALPFRDLADPTEADRADALDTLSGVVDGNHVPDLRALEDPEVAASYRQALEDGTLVDPAKAWGNAAIEGFGIGQPVRPPELDPAVPSASSTWATPVPAAAPTSPSASAAPAPASANPTIERDFEIPPDALVIAGAPDVHLLIAAGSPGLAYARDEQQFLVGLLGAALAIGSAVLVALALSGTFGPISGAGA